jgi:hypothetical protein
MQALNENEDNTVHQLIDYSRGFINLTKIRRFHQIVPSSEFNFILLMGHSWWYLGRVL